MRRPRSLGASVRRFVGLPVATGRNAAAHERRPATRGVPRTRPRIVQAARPATGSIWPKTQARQARRAVLFSSSLPRHSEQTPRFPLVSRGLRRHAHQTTGERRVAPAGRMRTPRLPLAPMYRRALLFFVPGLLLGLALPHALREPWAASERGALTAEPQLVRGLDAPGTTDDAVADRLAPKPVLSPPYEPPAALVDEPLPRRARRAWRAGHTRRRCVHW